MNQEVSWDLLKNRKDGERDLLSFTLKRDSADPNIDGLVETVTTVYRDAIASVEFYKGGTDDKTVTVSIYMIGNIHPIQFQTTKKNFVLLYKSIFGTLAGLDEETKKCYGEEKTSVVFAPTSDIYEAEKRINDIIAAGEDVVIMWQAINTVLPPRTAVLVKAAVEKDYLGKDRFYGYGEGNNRYHLGSTRIYRFCGKTGSSDLIYATFTKVD
jgi:hypothetical protein